MKNILAENMRRFKTKNLHEAAAPFGGNPQPDNESPEFQSIILTLDGKKHQVIYMNKGLTLNRTLSIAKQEDAYIPTRNQAFSLINYVSPNITEMIIWIDQGKTVSADMQYVQLDLANNGADIVSNGNDTIVSYNNLDTNRTENGTMGNYTVLLRDNPQLPPVVVTPK